MGDHACPTVDEYAGPTPAHVPPNLRITHHYVKDGGRWVCIHCQMPKEQA